MGIKDGQNSAMSDAFKKASETAQQTEAPQAEQGQAQTKTTEQPQGRFGLSRLNQALRRPMRRTGAGEITGKYLKGLMEARASENESNEGSLENLKLTTLDNGLPYSVIVLHMGFEQTAAAVSLVVEGSGQPLSPRVNNINGNQVEVEQVAGDLQSDYLWNRVRDAVSPGYENTVKLYDAGVIVIPRDMSPEDEPRMHSLLFDAVTALFGVIERAMGGIGEVFNVGMISTGNEVIEAKVEFNPGQTETTTGEVVRSDIAIQLAGTVNNGGQQGEAWAQEKVVLTDLTGYIDLVYEAPAAAATNAWGQPVQQNQQGWGAQAEPSKACYLPRFVMTGLTHATDAVTLEMQIAGMMTSTLMLTDHLWARTFMPVYGKQGTDLHDIAAVKHECKAFEGMTDVDTKAEGFTPAHLMQLLQMSVIPTLIYSLDVPEAGSQTWVQSAFVAAAQGNQDAMNAILNAANNFTKGEFAKIWDGSPVFNSTVTRVHNGYYVDADGQKRDIRDIDYLAMLNLVGDRDMQAVIDYADTFTNTQVPEDMRLQRRLQILKGILGEVHVTGYSRRVDVSAKFLLAVAQAAQNAGANIRPVGVYNEFAAGTRPSGNFGRFAADAGVNGSPVFNYNQGGFNRNTFAQQNARTIW